MARIRKGDTVFVRSGADRGKRGKVLSVLPDADKAVVEGVHLVFKHMKKGRKELPQGGRIQREAPVPLSILMPIDPSNDEPTRVSFRVVDGEKVRVARGSGTTLLADTKSKGGKKAESAAPKAEERS